HPFQLQGHLVIGRGRSRDSHQQRRAEHQSLQHPSSPLFNTTNQQASSQPRFDGCQNVTRFSSSTSAPKKAEPAMAAITIVAHTMSSDMRPTSVEMRNPMPSVGVPKNSATIAPISASDALIFNALNRNGIAAGSR